MAKISTQHPSIPTTQKIETTENSIIREEKKLLQSLSPSLQSASTETLSAILNYSKSLEVKTSADGEKIMVCGN